MRTVIETPKSSNIKSVAFDYDTHDLEVSFTSGGVYLYKAVPAHLFEAFGTVSSAGQHFQKNIKGHFTYTRVQKAGPQLKKLS